MYTYGEGLYAYGGEFYTYIEGYNKYGGEILISGGGLYTYGGWWSGSIPACSFACRFRY